MTPPVLAEVRRGGAVESIHRGAVALEALRQAEVLSEKDLTAVAPYAHPVVVNRKGLPVGTIRPVFALR